jgi:hypothetical protein
MGAVKRKAAGEYPTNMNTVKARKRREKMSNSEKKIDMAKEKNLITEISKY